MPLTKPYEDQMIEGTKDVTKGKATFKNPNKLGASDSST